MLKSEYDRSPVAGRTVKGGSANRLELSAGSELDTDGNGGIISELETEWAICAARLEKKTELDARLAEMIELIQEIRPMIAQTIVEEFGPTQ
jgi:hypothetical protein